jgi:transposase InsO family protein
VLGCRSPRPPITRRSDGRRVAGGSATSSSSPTSSGVWQANRCVYGPRKVYKQLRREGILEPRCRIERLMRELGLQGRVRGKKRRTTIPAEVSPRPPDLVDRRFKASAPNQLWIADITYVATWSGFAYAAFVTDVFSRRILGWRVSNTLRADLASTRSRWPSGPARARTSPGLCTTATGACKADSRGRRNTSSARGCDGNKQASSGGACKARADAFTWSTAGLAA